jgi:hypothetical protein
MKLAQPRAWGSLTAWALLLVAVLLSFLGAVNARDQRIDDWLVIALLIAILSAASAATALLVAGWDR